jgi:hypothetical protein
MARTSGGRRVRRGLVWGIVVGEEIVDEAGDEGDGGYRSIGVDCGLELRGAQIWRSWMRSRTVSFQRWPVV